MSRCVEVSPEPGPEPMWWEGREAYWDLPFYAEMDACCEAQTNRDDSLAGREQLWAMRELNEEPGEDVDGLDLESNNRQAKTEIRE